MKTLILVVLIMFLSGICIGQSISKDSTSKLVKQASAYQKKAMMYQRLLLICKETSTWRDVGKCADLDDSMCLYNAKAIAIIRQIAKKTQ